LSILTNKGYTNAMPSYRIMILSPNTDTLQIILHLPGCYPTYFRRPWKWLAGRRHWHQNETRQFTKRDCYGPGSYVWAIGYGPRWHRTCHGGARQGCWHQSCYLKFRQANQLHRTRNSYTVRWWEWLRWHFQTLCRCQPRYWLLLTGQR